MSRCIGCGAKIQTTNPEKIGYVPEIAMIERGEQVYCKRCYDIRHHNALYTPEYDTKMYYDKIKNNLKVDKISPHSCILFSERSKDKYLIDNYVFSKDIDSNQSKKGKYDLFKAFAVEEITITLNLYIDGDISAQTFKKVKKDYKRFVAELYFDYCIRKQPCSYKLDNFNESMGIFFKKSEVINEIIIVVISRIINKIKLIVRGK